MLELEVDNFVDVPLLNDIAGHQHRIGPAFRQLLESPVELAYRIRFDRDYCSTNWRGPDAQLFQVGAARGVRRIPEVSNPRQMWKNALEELQAFGRKIGAEGRAACNVAAGPSPILHEPDCDRVTDDHCHNRNRIGCRLR